MRNCEREKQLDLGEVTLTSVKEFFDRLRSYVGAQAKTARNSTNGEPAQRELAEKNRRLKKLRERLEEKDRELAELRAKLATREAGTETSSVKPENIVWIFGVGRSGSSWLAAMMGEIEGHRVWFEPQLGELFDSDRLGIGIHEGRHFIFSDHYRESWLRSVRNFVLEGATARFPEGAGVLVVKEPHGSAGAPLLAEALPESRLILLVRDPRDVISSAVDALTRGMWRGRVWRGMYGGLDESPDAFVEGAARSYLQHMSNARRAYDVHKGYKVLIRYEDLRADALGVMEHVYSTLKIVVQDEALARAVEKHSWDNVPAEKKGRGRFYRKATPGTWGEDLTKEQVEVVERITAPVIEEFYQQ